MKWMFTDWTGGIWYNGYLSHRRKITCLDAAEELKTSSLVYAYLKTICKHQDHSKIYCNL